MAETPQSADTGPDYWYPMTLLGAAFGQSMFISKPTFTEKELEDQTGKVHVVTGGYTGVGEQLVQIFYSKNATVYVAGRSKEKADAGIARIKAAVPESKGRLEFLSLDLADLTSIKSSAEAFLAKETRLDTLTNNAGVMNTSADMKTAQGYELQMGTNCLGPWLFTHHLLPLLQKTAASAAANSVRVTWAASLASWGAPRNGIAYDPKTGQPKISLKEINYCQSKAANIYLASEFARRYGKGKDGIVSVSWNPGNLSTELQRHTSFVQKAALYSILYPAKMGAYTELYAACSPDVTVEDGGAFIAPWGRKYKPRADLEKGTRPKSEGGSGAAEEFWVWCEKETKAYL